MTLQAPFPWFGGKSRAAHLVWPRLGNVPNYVEPFAGSLAVMLRRPHAPGTETVNDIDGYLVNFWRSVTHAPEETAECAFWPVSECDILARHRWLLSEGAARVQRLKADPEFYDVKVAGWWVWGLSCWIGSGWCTRPANQLPHLGNDGRGVIKKLPHLGNDGRGDWSDLIDWFRQLSRRLLRVRIACGDWGRVLGPSVTEKHGMTGIVLDPPYSTDLCEDVYRTGSISGAVFEWAIENGDNPLLRIAMCGYEGEHEFPASWECVAWKAAGGFASQSHQRGRENCAKERIWFSPHCLKLGLFAELESAS